MSKVFKEHGIPLTALQSYKSTWEALTGIEEHFEAERNQEKALAEKRAQLIFKQLTGDHHEINLLCASISKELNNNPKDKLIQTLEGNIAGMKEKLNFYALNKDKITQVRICCIHSGI